jgi:hypothetical protein
MCTHPGEQIPVLFSLVMHPIPNTSLLLLFMSIAVVYIHVSSGKKAGKGDRMVSQEKSLCC